MKEKGRERERERMRKKGEKGEGRERWGGREKRMEIKEHGIKESGEVGVY